MLIAIDGPAGAGKSTVAKAVARAMGFTYLDTGAMYRCVALAELQGEDPLSVVIALGDRVTANGRDVTGEIRTPAVSAKASEVAARPEVRAALVAKQRDLIAAGDYVAEGRDIGTVVAPDAELKVFLTASPQERARRRAAELGVSAETVLADQTERDARDSTRDVGPLVAAADSVEVDTTGLDVEQVVERIVSLARTRAT